MRTSALACAAAAAVLALGPIPASIGQPEQPEQQRRQRQAAPPGTVTSSVGELRIQRLATLEFPWAIAMLPDGRLLITEKPGRLRIWDNGQLSGPIRGVPEVVHRGPEDQGGLLDVEVDPDFEQNGFIYLSFAEAAEQQSSEIGETGDYRLGSMDPSDNIIRGGAVARARLEEGELRDLRVIWRQTPKTLGRGHLGHRILFAPDGTLLITSGDRMRFDPAQELASNLGKVVRINPDGSIPQDNPFVGQEDAREDIWSYGHRNILAAAIDPYSGRLWAFEMGPLGGDEVNLVRRGRNYGWPLVGDGAHYGDPGVPTALTVMPLHATNAQYEAPVRTWTPVVSPSGAAFYTGTLFPGWRGSVLVGGLSSQAIVRLAFDGENIALEERIDMGRRIRDVLEAPDGSILVIVDDASGDLLRLTPVDAGQPQRQR